MEAIAVKRLMVLIFLSLLTLPAFAQTQKIPIYFSCTCDDVVGSSYASAMRDLIATSPRYRPIYSSSEMIDGKKVDRFHISVVSVDPSDNNLGLTTALSAVFLIGDDYFLANRIQTFPASRAQDAARNTLAVFDNMVADAQAARAKQH
jgi:hypothetical protein